MGKTCEARKHVIVLMFPPASRHKSRLNSPTRTGIAYSIMSWSRL